MRKLIVVLAVVLLALSVAAVAQDTPKVEVFGGYSILRVDTEGVSSGTFGPGANMKENYNGWAVEAQYNLKKWVGLTADISGNYGTPVTIPGVTVPSANSFTFLFGPTVYHQAEHARPFLHFLVGGNRVTNVGPLALADSTITDSGFAFALGGGLDVKITKRISIRPGQGDWLYTKHNFCAIAGESPIGCQAFLINNGLPGSLGRPHQNNFRFATGVVFEFGER